MIALGPTPHHGSQCRYYLPLTDVNAEAQRGERFGLGNRPSWCHVQVSSIQPRFLLHYTSRNIKTASQWPELVQNLRISKSCSREKTFLLLCTACEFSLVL